MTEPINIYDSWTKLFSLPVCYDKNGDFNEEVPVYYIAKIVKDNLGRTPEDPTFTARHEILLTPDSKDEIPVDLLGLGKWTIRVQACEFIV